MAMPTGLRNQWIAAIAASSSGLGSGAAYGWLTPLLPRLAGGDWGFGEGEGEDEPLAGQRLALAASAVELGCLCGEPPAAAAAARAGRRLVALASAPLLLLSWTLLVRWRSAAAIVVARFVQGLAAGVQFASVPGYVDEVAGRGAGAGRWLRPLFAGCWWAGYSAAAAAGGPLALGWLPATLLAAALNAPFLLLFTRQPDSPAFHLAVGDEERAARTLLHFREGLATTDEVRRELEDMRARVERNDRRARASAWRELSSTASDSRALRLLLALVTVRVASGGAAVAVYGALMFGQIPDGLSPYGVAVAFGLTMMVGGLVGHRLVDAAGRRPLLVGSCALSALCHATTAAYFYLMTSDAVAVDVSAASWLPVVCVLLYAFFYSAGMNPVIEAYSSELFRPTARGAAAGLATSFTTLLAFVLVAVYPAVLHDFGAHANFCLYSSACVCGAAYFFLCAPETRAKPFFQIRKELTSAGDAVERESEREPLFTNEAVDQL